jgi:hypothetical protein
VVATSTLTVPLATPMIALTSFALPLARAGETFRFVVQKAKPAPKKRRLAPR